MGPNMYLYEKVRQAHNQDLQREAEKRRLLLQLSRQHGSVSRRVAGKLGLLLLRLGTRLKQLEQPDCTPGLRMC
jgi:hypothetical protein